jgi:hypothetical protein
LTASTTGWSLGVRVRAIPVDPECAPRIEEVWGDLYPLIVMPDGPADAVTIQPSAIPADTTLILAAERDQRRPDRPPALVVRQMLVSGSGPVRVGAVFKRLQPLARFDAASRAAVDHAREEARDLGHHSVGPVHIALGVLHERESLAAQALNALGITLERVRTHAARTVVSAKGVPSAQTAGSAPFTPRAMQVLQRAPVEAESLGSDHVASEHILLALIGGNEPGVAGILRECGANPKDLRDAVIRLTRPA